MDKINKKGQIGEGVMMIYRLLMICAVAFAVFGVSSFYYGHHVNVRDAEAVIMTREVSDCLAPSGVLNLDEVGEENYNAVLSYCGFSSVERFYVEVNVLDSSGSGIAKLYQGDSGALWMRDLFGKVVSTGNAIVGGAETTENIEKFNPGYFNSTYPVFIVKDGNKIKGSIEVEVLVSHEE